MTGEAGLVVADASAVVMFVADESTVGDWVTSQLTDRRIAAPALMPYEVGNALRRRELAGDLDAPTAAIAHADLLALRVDLWPHSRLASRMWELRGAVTYYDAAYVALAELLEAPLVTLDRRLAAAPGPRCEFRVPAR